MVYKGSVQRQIVQPNFPNESSGITLLQNPKVCIQYCSFMSSIKQTLRKTQLERHKGSTVPQTHTRTKNCHSISSGLINRQSKERCEIVGFLVTVCLALLKMNPSYFCRSLWLSISYSSQLSFLGCRPCLVRKHLPFSKAKEIRQQSTDTRQTGYRYRKSCSVFKLPNYAKI